MQYGNTYPKGVKPVSTAKAAGANVKESRLNAGSHTSYRGSRGSVKRTKGGMKGGKY